MIWHKRLFYSERSKIHPPQYLTNGQCSNNFIPRKTKSDVDVANIMKRARMVASCDTFFGASLAASCDMSTHFMTGLSASCVTSFPGSFLFMMKREGSKNEIGLVTSCNRFSRFM